MKNIHKDSVVNYVYFLTHEGERPPIVDQDTIINCFEIYNRTEDMSYFSYLIENLHNFWTLLSPILYMKVIDIDVLWDIYFECPYQVLPKSLLSEDLFFSEWMKRNGDGRKFTLNHNEKFSYRKTTDLLGSVMTEEQIKERGQRTGYNLKYSTPQEGKEGEEEEITVIKKVDWRGNVRSQVNNLLQGEEVVYFPEIKQVGNSINSKLNGVYLDYDLNSGNLIQETYYLDNKREGIQRNFYPDGKRKSEALFQDGDLIAILKSWRDDEDSTLASETVLKDNIPVSKINYYPDGDYSETIYWERSSYATGGGLPNQLTMYNKYGHSIWQMKYIPDISQSVLIVFDQREPNVAINEKLIPQGWSYDFGKRLWTNPEGQTFSEEEMIEQL